MPKGASAWRPNSRSVAVAGFVVAIGVSLGAVADAAYEPVSAELRSAAWLKVKGITVRGTQYLSVGDVRTSLPDLMGTNILSVDVDSLAAHISKHSRIRSAQVSRNLLMRSIDVRVEERVAVALVLTNAGHLEEVDRDGTHLPIGLDRVPHDLVFLTGTEEGGASGIHAGISIARALRGLGLEVLLSEIDVSDPGYPVATGVDTGTRIEFSNRYPVQKQAEHLAVVLDNISESDVMSSIIDLRFPNVVEVLPGAQIDRSSDSGHERK